MRTRTLLYLLAFVAVFIRQLRADDDDPSTRVFEMSALPTAEAVEQALTSRAGLKPIPEDQTNYLFIGSAVLMNDKLAFLLRTQPPALSLFARSETGWKRRASISASAAPLQEGKILQAFRLIENASGGVRAAADFAGSTPLRLSFRLTAGEPILEIKSLEARPFIEVLSESPNVIVPDYFGDDLVYGNRPFQGLLPSENFFLSLLRGGEAMLMTVAQSSSQDAVLDQPLLGERGNQSRHWVQCAPSQTVWVAAIEARGVWAARPQFDSSSNSLPFPAKWRASYHRENSVADTWDVEHGPRASQLNGSHQGPLITYLMDRSAATPLNAICPTDVMRNTLGVGPCQYILACEGLGSQGDPTPNNVMGWVEKQFEQKKQRKSATEIKGRVQVMLKHLIEARSRLQCYADSSRSLRASIASTSSLAMLGPLVDELDRSVQPGLTNETSPAHAQALAEAVETLVDANGTTAQCKDLGAQLRAFGALQDRALAKSRMALRRLRQESRTMAAGNGAVADSAMGFIALTDQALQNK